MQCQNIWTVDSEGSVHLYGVKHRHWQSLNYQRLEFKRISASPIAVWAVGGDFQIYIYVPASEVPIRVCALTYENQRWNPFSQFSSTLLPTDRPLFSSEDGVDPRPKESFKMPSKSWQWEGEWYIETSVEGEPLGPEGWTYAIDFPMQFTADRRWNSLVRRRKWIRYRRYVAVNQWALIDSIHGDFVAEPFIDIACGGYDVPGGGSHDSLAVWAVTVIGRVVFRAGVDKLLPEGSAWINIDVPTGWEVNQVSCGPTGLTWAVAWDGSALVRSGVTRDNLRGANWLRVEPPNESKLMQLSVGVDAVWAVTRDGKVWFRRGVRGLNSGVNDASATGSGWVEMIQKMAILSVTANDQVWAISSDKKCIYFRAGISYGELTGKAWKLVPQSPPTNQRLINNNLIDNNVQTLLDNVSESSEDSSSAIQETNENVGWCWLSASSCTVNADQYFQFSTSSLGSQGSLSLSVGSSGAEQTNDCGEWRHKILSQLLDKYEKEMKDFVMSYQPAVESGTWIKSGSCYIGLKKEKSYFNWYMAFLELERHGLENGDTDSGTLTITYSFSSSTSPSKASENKKIVLNLSEIMCVLCNSCDSLNSSLCILMITAKDETIVLKFRAETELEDWLATANIACGNLNGINGSTATSGAALWAIMVRGDLYVGHRLSGASQLFYYHFGGGHFQQVTACGRVIWALSYDGVLWTYSGGYGGGIYKGITGVNCGPITDTISLCCYENQRWNPLTGFAPKGIPTDRYMWSDESGKIELTKDTIKLPSRHWHWITDWNVDYSTPGGVDSDGWQYAIDFPFDYYPERKFQHYVRRRRWYRKCQMNTTGPWIDLNLIPLVSISIHSPKKVNDTNSGEDIPIFAWAVSEDGDALCRTGVSTICPRGLSWQHVPCEQPLTNVSVGGDENTLQVWAIARDGSVFLRHGIGERCPTGSVWFHIEQPRSKCPLRQISVGRRSVWAIDDKRRLWHREEIVDTFPEGTHWKKVDDNVVQVSIHKSSDELWAIVRRIVGDSLVSRVAKRVGINFDENNKTGTDWEFMNSSLNCVQYICCTVD